MADDLGIVRPYQHPVTMAPGGVVCGGVDPLLRATPRGLFFIAFEKRWGVPETWQGLVQVLPRLRFLRHNPWLEVATYA